MIDRQDLDGKISVLDPNDVETILLGDRLYILLLKEHLKKLEKSPGANHALGCRRLHSWLDDKAGRPPAGTGRGV